MADPVENDPGHNPPGLSRHERTVPEPEELSDKVHGETPLGSPLSLESEPPDPTLQGVIEDPVEILVGLAERGEIDPWNINIIEVTDRFLSELERCRQLESPGLRAYTLLCRDPAAHEVRTSRTPVRSC